MVLKDELDAFTRELLQEVDNDADRLFKGQIDQARSYKVPDRALYVGSIAPNFTLPSATGEMVELRPLLDEGPVVLTFYRGGWCPYCNIQLRAYQRMLNDLAALNAQLVAISPETPDNTMETLEREKLEFHVLSDNDNRVARQFGLIFKVSSDVHSIFRKWDIDLEEHNGAGGGELPVPATYVIDETGIIIFGQPDVDYRTRTDPDEILSILRSR